MDFFESAEYSASTNTFTAASAGTYRFDASAEWLAFGVTNGIAGIEIRKNGTAVSRTFQHASSNTINTVLTNAVIKLAAGDLVQVFVLQSSGFSQQVGLGTGTKFTGYRLY